MKKIFYLLFISSVVFGSCTKDEPVEVVCTCDGATNGTGTSSSSSFFDENLIGHWKNTTPLVNLGTHSDAQNVSNIGDIDVYFSPDGVMHLNHTHEYDSSTIFYYSDYTFKFIDEGILCLTSSGYNRIIHYEINNGVLTYYSEQDFDYAFKAYTSSSTNYEGLYFGSAWSNYDYYRYYVQTNSLTKQ